MVSQTAQTKATGGALLLLAAVVFVYYSLWVLVTPFVDADHPLQAYFPDRALAILLPTLAFILVTTAAGLFVGVVMMKSARSASAAKKTA